MIARVIGFGFATARDFLARGLVKIGVTPNGLTLMGAALMVGTGICYGLGAGAGFAWSFDPSAADNAYMIAAAVLIFLSNACDMLDGAVARIGNAKTEFGAFLDSTMDRLSDFAVYAGIAVYYARGSSSGDLLYVFLASLAFFNAVMISYTRARAEDIIKFCTVGYWQRGERSAAILIATCAHNIPALLVQQALSPMMTVLRRMLYTKAVIAGRKPITDPREGTWRQKVLLWRWPRGTIAYEIVTGANIAWLIFAPADDLVRWCMSVT